MCETAAETCYLLIGEAPTADIAQQIALRFKACPYVHFIAAFGPMLTAVYYLPEEQRWWIELVASQPQLTLGLKRAAVYRTEHPAYPEAYLPRVQGKSERAPCGSICTDCERFEACRGCPGVTR
jgi:hypothetical protein